MKKLLFLLVAPALLLIGGCNDDDDYSLGDLWRSIATVENPNQENYFFFRTDGGLRMWTGANDLRNYYPKDGQRIIAFYTIISDRSSGSNYDHDVIFRGVYEILTKDIVEITEENNEKLGNDPIQVKEIRVGSDYLNVEFMVDGQNKKHAINLGRDASKEYNDGKIHLELRHNANGDDPSRELSGMASFNLAPLQVEGEKSLTLVIHSLPSEGGEEKTQEVTYNFNEIGSGPEITFSLEGEMANIE